MRKRTKRERQMALSQKRHRHELRKRRKDGPDEINKPGEHSPNRMAMFKPKKANAT